MYDIDKFYQATSINDAVCALNSDQDAVIISGGSDVLIKIREGKLAGCSLVSIHGIEELQGITMDEEGTIIIKPATTFSHITNHPLIQEHIPTLGDAVDQVGGPQIRNIGTIGGNVCNGVTSADSASTLFTLNAVLELTSDKGIRNVSIHDFYTGAGRTVREHAELLTGIKITKDNYEGFGGCYIKYGQRNAMEIATLGCAVHVKLDHEKKRVDDLRLGFGVAGPTPLRCTETENLAKGMELSGSLLKAVSEGALKEVNPRSSWRASKEFRLQLVQELSKRALKQAIMNAGGEIDA